MNIKKHLLLIVAFLVLPFATTEGQVYENHVGNDVVDQEETWFTLESELGIGIGIGSGSGSNTASVFGGWSFPDYRDTFGRQSYPSQRLVEGSTVGFAVGKRVAPRLRSELEFTWRHNDVESYYDGWSSIGRIYTLPYFGDARMSGAVNTYSGMYNLIFDFDRAPNRLLTPYAGVGLGLSYADTDVSWGGRGATISNETAFAYQAIGGMSLKVRPAADFFVEYRYFATASVAYSQPGYSNMYTTLPEMDFYHSFQSHQLLMGMRFKY